MLVKDKKYRLKQDIQLWPDLTYQHSWYNADHYKKDDIIIYNEWIDKFGKWNDTYDFRMFSKSYIEQHPELFEEIKEEK